MVQGPSAAEGEKEARLGRCGGQRHSPTCHRQEEEGKRSRRDWKRVRGKVVVERNWGCGVLEGSLAFQLSRLKGNNLAFQLEIEGSEPQPPAAAAAAAVTATTTKRPSSPWPSLFIALSTPCFCAHKIVN